jgi:tetratricopeptide (TPR) repeat protein
MNRSDRLLCLLFAALAGCAALPTSSTSPSATPGGTPPAKSATAAGGTPPPPAAPAESLARKELAAGEALYNAGDYAAAIRDLNASAAIWKADTATQTEALKYIAFSYCVTGRPGPCKQEFQKALRLDPAFDLAPGEQDHPLWGPVFDKAKKGH